MSKLNEKQALVLSFLGIGIGLLATMFVIKLLGGGPEAIALAVPFFICAGAWHVAGVVMRHGDDDHEH